MSKKKRKPDKKRFPERKLSSKQADLLADAQSLMRTGRWQSAAERLAQLDREYPNRPEILETRLEVAEHFQDHHQAQDLCERLLLLRPRDPELHLFFAGVCMRNMRLAQALRAFHTFLERWPNHPQAEKARETAARLDEIFRGRVADLGFVDGPDALQLAAWHEEIQGHLENGRYTQCCQLADRLLQVCPNFAPALNNSGEAHWRASRFDQAIACARRVLSFDPDNLHALCNLTRYLALTGQTAEAEGYAARLRTLKPKNSHDWVKIAETFAYLGDDLAILAAEEAVREEVGKVVSVEGAELAHYAAVAAYRTGDEQKARWCWEEALRLYPGYEEPRRNLADLGKPIEQRHAAWPFAITYWIPMKLIQEFVERTGVAEKRKRSPQEEAQRYLADHPEVAALIPILLDRGDPDGRFLALNIATSARSPEMLEVLQRFALSNRGPDNQRMQAGNVVAEAGLIHGPMQFWSRGQWRQVMLRNYDIHSEPRKGHSGPVEELVKEAVGYLDRADGVRAESALRRALELEPDAVDLKNNLVGALMAQERHEEADTLAQAIHAQHPDNLIAAAAVARMNIRKGQLDAARALLDGLLQVRRLHVAEFVSLAIAEIDLGLARNMPEVAASWIDMWERIQPNDPRLHAMREIVRHHTREQRPTSSWDPDREPRFDQP